MLTLSSNAYASQAAAGGLPRPDEAGRGAVVHLQLLSIKPTSADSVSPLIPYPI